MPKVDEWETVGDKRFRWSGWLSAVVLVAVMLICSAVYAWIQRPKPSVTAQANRPVQSQPRPRPQPHSRPRPRRPPPRHLPRPRRPHPHPLPYPCEPPQGKAAQTKPAQPHAGGAKARQTRSRGAEAHARRPHDAGNPRDATVHVEITADEAVWVSARADGKYSFSATMDPHATRTIDGVKEVTLRLGNAGGVSISLNGKPIGPAGPKGQVRTIQFTSGGFQIVPAKPPSVRSIRSTVSDAANCAAACAPAPAVRGAGGS